MKTFSNEEIERFLRVNRAGLGGFYIKLASEDEVRLFRALNIIESLYNERKANEATLHVPD